MSRFLTIPFVLVVIVSLVLTTPVNGTIVIKVRLRTSPSPNNVLLECQDTMNTPLPNAVFQRALGSSDQFMSFNYTSSDEFVVTPQIEGRYRCQDGGMTSNAIDLVGKQALILSHILSADVRLIVFVPYGNVKIHVGCAYTCELVGCWMRCSAWHSMYTSDSGVECVMFCAYSGTSVNGHLNNQQTMDQ